MRVIQVRETSKNKKTKTRDPKVQPTYKEGN